jgi:hypothetical protein
MTETVTPTRVRPDIAWKEVNEDRYMEMLECLWPACDMEKAYGFLVGGPWDHRTCSISQIDGQPAYAPFLKSRGGRVGDPGVRYVEGDKPMTRREFFALKHAQIDEIFAELPAPEAPAPTETG